MQYPYHTQQTKIIPSKLLINKKQILPGRTLNLEYALNNSSNITPQSNFTGYGFGSGIEGGSFLSYIPILGPLVDKLLGTGIYPSQDVMYDHTNHPYNSLNSFPILTGENLPIGAGIAGRGIDGGFLQFLPLIPTALDILGRLLKGNGLTHYSKYIDEPLKDVDVEFIDSTSGQSIYSQKAKLNGLGVKLIHEPELVTKIIAHGSGIAGRGIAGRGIAGRGNMEGGFIMYTPEGHTLYIQPNFLATTMGSAVHGLRNINEI